MIDVIKADWDAPSCIRVMTTTRQDGYSKNEWSSLNLATHVGDDLNDVNKNREKLIDELNLPSIPAWLNQTHSTNVNTIECHNEEADAFYTTTPGVVGVVLTADCLPLVLTNKEGTAISVIHAGWRGLADGIIEKSAACFDEKTPAYYAWLGPAIGPKAFEVGDDVYDAFIAVNTNASSAFKAIKPGYWLVDIYELARLRLKSAGVDVITGGQFCTYADQNQFYSFRRENQTGRVATLAWID